MQRSPWSYTPPSLLSFLNVSFISRDTALLFFFLFFLRLSYVPLYSPVALYFHVSSRPYPRISASLSPRSLLFSLLSSPFCPVYSTVPACFIFLYPLPFFDVPAGPTIPSSIFVFLSHIYTAYLHPLSLSLSKSLILPMYMYIYSTFFIRSPSNPSSSYLPVSHKFNPTSLRLAPYTFHCSIKRPRVYTRVYTMNCRRPEGKSNARRTRYFVNMDDPVQITECTTDDWRVTRDLDTRCGLDRPIGETEKKRLCKLHPIVKGTFFPRPPVSLSLQLPAMISSVISIQLSDLHLDADGFFDVSP